MSLRVLACLLVVGPVHSSDQKECSATKALTCSVVSTNNLLEDTQLLQSQELSGAHDLQEQDPEGEGASEAEQAAAGEAEQDLAGADQEAGAIAGLMKQGNQLADDLEGKVADAENKALAMAHGAVDAAEKHAHAGVNKAENMAKSFTKHLGPFEDMANQGISKAANWARKKGIPMAKKFIKNGLTNIKNKFSKWRKGAFKRGKAKISKFIKGGWKKIGGHAKKAVNHVKNFFRKFR